MTALAPAQIAEKILAGNFCDGFQPRQCYGADLVGKSKTLIEAIVLSANGSVNVKTWFFIYHLPCTIFTS